MGVDFYLKWSDQTDEEHDSQITGFASVGDRGYIRESYGGSTLATEVFCPESFSDGENCYVVAEPTRGALSVTVDDLRARMPAVEAACVSRAGARNDYAEQHYKAFEDFLALAEAKLAEGRRVWIYNSY